MKMYSLNQNFFEIIDTEEKAYWLGFLYADGCIYVAKNRKEVILELSTQDIEHIGLFNKHINSNRKIKITKRGYARLEIFNTKMVDDLINLGCISRKSLKVKFPTEEIVPRYLIHHFIRGYMDGDGCICPYYKNIKGRKKPYFTCEVKFVGTFEMIKGIKDFFNSDKIILRPKHAKNICNINFKVRKHLKEVLFLYENATVYLERKKAKLDEYLVYLQAPKRPLEGRPIVQLDLKYNFIKEYENANRAKGFDGGVIGKCCRKIDKFKTHKGYIWMYADEYYNAKKI